MTDLFLEKTFPELSYTGYNRTSPADTDYNCVAHAVGDTENWWWPQDKCVWPGPVFDVTVEAFVTAFATQGFEPCGLDDTCSPNYCKVAIYAKGSEVKHVARQLEDGRWSSKCGVYIDFSHNLSGLEGDLYGQVVLILRKLIV